MAVFQDKPAVAVAAATEDTVFRYENIDEDPSGVNRIMPFEFLYLLTNARNRADALM